MKNALFAASAILTGLGTLAQATTVSFSPAPSARTITTADGSVLAPTSLVLLGNFSSEAFFYNPALSASANFTAISTAGGWEQFGFDTQTGVANAGVSNTVAINASGKIGGSLTDNTTGATKADFFNGKTAYLWIFDGPSIANSNTMGIFKDPTETSPNIPWIYPSNAGGAPGDTVAFGTTVGSNPNVSAVAGVGSVTNSGGPNERGRMLLAVPEPSTALLSAVGAIVMIARRRRAQSRV